MTTAVGKWPAYARNSWRSLRQATYPQLLHHYRGHDLSRVSGACRNARAGRFRCRCASAPDVLRPVEFDGNSRGFNLSQQIEKWPWRGDRRCSRRGKEPRITADRASTQVGLRAGHCQQKQSRPLIEVARRSRTDCRRCCEHERDIHKAVLTFHGHCTPHSDPSFRWWPVGLLPA